MQNDINFTRLGLFISRFYPKVCELRQFQNRDKTAQTRCKYNVYNIYIWVIIPRQVDFIQPWLPYPAGVTLPKLGSITRAG